MKNKLIFVVIFVGALLLSGLYYYLSQQRINPLSKSINPKDYGPLCGEIVNTCNNLVAINCQAEADGPFYYVDANSGKIVSRCGGECLSGTCEGQCPPKEWTCK